MKLVTIEVENFRRFEKRARLETYGPVVCLVGPNEAGKSSLLEAMMALNESGELSEQDSTRDSSGVAKVSASYLLDDGDRSAISRIPGGDLVRWWTVSRTPGRNLTVKLVPDVPIDLQHRKKTRSTLSDYVLQKDLRKLGKAGKLDPQKMIDETLALLGSENERLTNRQIKVVRDLGKMLANQVKQAASSATDEDYEEFLRHLSSYDEGPSFREQVIDILALRRPLFVRFDEPDRDLRSSYDLARYAAAPPSALRNVAELANLDLAELLAVMKSGPATRRTTLVENAKARLMKSFEDSWRQATIGIGIDTEGTTLELSIFDHEIGEYTELRARSDGLRWFVGFRAFMERANEPDRDPPILLVDEAESHLHYDAQADLVQLFYDQPVANKVIYTTHSAGCLPQDLGASIRVVRPVENARSVVLHNPWIEQDTLGITPLVHGMGATALAFMPSRRAVMVEGATDAMLYPTLFREVTGEWNLEFQVVPGVSFVDRASQASLKMESTRLAFLVDNDCEGRRYRDELSKGGIDSDAIVVLGENESNDIELEDLIDPEVLALIAMSIARDFGDPDDEIKPSDVPPFGRTDWLEQWTITNEVAVDKKTIAVRLLEMKSDALQQGEDLQILWSERTNLVSDIYERLRSLLALSKPEVE